MTTKLPTLIATSVVRGSQQGESHGGIFTVDFENQELVQHVDWNTSSINFEGRGADRGLRGIEFDGDDILIAASDELFRFDRSFEIKSSNRNRYLRHCHEICRMERKVFLTSTGFDSLLAFDLDEKKFVWGFHLLRQNNQWTGHTFNPTSEMGPRPVNQFHINMVHVNDSGIYFSGLHTNALLYLNSKMEVTEVCSLPAGSNNPRPYRDGVLFNDTDSDHVRYVGRDGKNLAFKIASYDESNIEFAGVDDSKIARQGFGRGLCLVGDRFVAAGSSPSTISLYDFENEQKVGSVNLTMDIRNAIHGLELWPFDD
jgi:hypothetical protein